MREIDLKLAEIVPKIAEVNNVCQELRRGDYYYEPAITTEVLNDGRKVSKVVCKVYPNRNNKDVYNILPFDKFEDTYFQIKDKYNNIMGEDIDEEDLLEELKKDNYEQDGEVFGLSSDNDWQLIGYMYYFLVSVVNLVETKNDDTPIIDNKGSIVGKMNYSVGLDLFDSDGKRPLNILKYNTLGDLLGKKLKFTLDLKKASDLPEKLCHEVLCRYQWLDEDRSQFESKVAEEQTRNPVFGYHNEHVIDIDEDLISYMVENTLTVGVYGKVEPKKKLAVVEEKQGGLHVVQEEDEEFKDENSSKVDPSVSGLKQANNSLTRHKIMNAQVKDERDIEIEKMKK